MLQGNRAQRRKQMHDIRRRPVSDGGIQLVESDQPMRLELPMWVHEMTYRAAREFKRYCKLTGYKPRHIQFR